MKQFVDAIFPADATIHDLWALMEEYIREGHDVWLERTPNGRVLLCRDVPGARA